MRETGAMPCVSAGSSIVLDWAGRNRIEITAARLALLEALQARVLAVNARMNLTAITSGEDFAVKHIIDSLTLLPYVHKNAALIDIGAGAGFPGLVLGIMRDDIRLTLLDSLRKRILFLRETAALLGLAHTECVHARAEDWARAGARYDICTARAVAALGKLAGYALPLLRPGGLLLAMKGPNIAGELEKAKPAIKKHGGQIDRVDHLEIPGGLRRSIAVVVKPK